MTALFCLVSGCAQNCDLIFDENKQLSDQNAQLQRNLETATEQITQLKSQLSTISGIDPNINISDIISVDQIKIADRTGFFDKDYKGLDETLIVYLKTLDQYGDAIKGAGAVNIEIWDLSLNEDKAKLASWKITPNQLKNSWASSMMTNYYRLTFDISKFENITASDITVKVTFTDYLTGKVLEKQKVITAKPAPKQTANFRYHRKSIASID